MTIDTKEVSSQTINHGVFDEHSRVSSTSCRSLDKEEAALPACRVCQCAESDKRGDAALEFLGITPTLHHKTKKEDTWKDVKSTKNGRIEFVSPDGEVFVCNTTDDVEMGLDHANAEEVVLVELGCSCKNDLALVHYACALKWFVNHGSTICEICECVAKNITISDLKKVVSSLKEYELLRERTANGVLENPAQISSSGVDPDAVAAIRRQRLSEISLWFGPHNNNNNNSSNSARISQPERNSVVFDERQHEVDTAENPATKWVVEGTGILLATGLLTVTLAWLIAPRVGKKTAKSGLHILLGGICALTVVVFFRFFVLTRIKYGPARYWAILFIFWFLVFGIWASRTHGAHAT